MKQWKYIVRYLIKTLNTWEIDIFYYIKFYYFKGVLIYKYIEKLDELYDIFQSQLQIALAKFKEEKIRKRLNSNSKTWNSIKER